MKKVGILWTTVYTTIDKIYPLKPEVLVETVFQRLVLFSQPFLSS